MIKLIENPVGAGLSLDFIKLLHASFTPKYMSDERANVIQKRRVMTTTDDKKGIDLTCIKYSNDKIDIVEVIKRIIFILIKFKFKITLGPFTRIIKKKTTPTIVKIGIGNVLLSANRYVEPKTT